MVEIDPDSFYKDINTLRENLDDFKQSLMYHTEEALRSDWDAAAIKNCYVIFSNCISDIEFVMLSLKNPSKKSKVTKQGD